MEGIGEEKRGRSGDRKREEEKKRGWERRRQGMKRKETKTYQALDMSDHH